MKKYEEKLYNCTLPKKLSKDEEKKLFEAFDEESKRILIESNLRLVIRIANRFNTQNESIEDLVSIGSIGLIKAVNTYNPNKKIKFSTYAGKCIRNEILMYLRKYKHEINANIISIFDPIAFNNDGDEISLIEVLEDTNAMDIDKYLDDLKYKKIILKTVENLSDNEKDTFKLLYCSKGKRLSQKKVGQILGISQSQVSRIEKKLIKTFKKALKPYL